MHLRKYKGGTLWTKPVFEILHAATFTGLLNRKGAEENPRITQVAAARETVYAPHPGGSPLRSACGGSNPLPEELPVTQEEGGPQMDAKPKEQAVLAILCTGELKLVDELKPLEKRLRRHRHRIDALFPRHRDAELFRSLPRAAPKTAPRPVSHVGTGRDRYESSRSLTAAARIGLFTAHRLRRG